MGEEFVIISNDGLDAVTGQFDGLPEGSLLTNFLGSGLSALLTYEGGNGGNDVTLTAVPPVLHWQGDVDGNWSTAGNWLENYVPYDGVQLVFDTTTAGFDAVTAGFVPNNDVTGLLVDTLSINDQSATDNFVVTGNAISLSGGVTIDGDRTGSPFSRFDLAGVTLTGSQVFDVNMQYFNWWSPIDIQSHTWTMQGFDTRLHGVISGSGDVVFNSGLSYVNAANDYSGQTTIETGTVVLQSSGQLGTTGTGTIGGNGGRLILSVDSAENLDITATTFILELRKDTNHIGDINFATTNALNLVYSTGNGDGTATISGDLTGTAGGTGVQINVPTNSTLQFSGKYLHRHYALDRGRDGDRSGSEHAVRGQRGQHHQCCGCARSAGLTNHWIIDRCSAPSKSTRAP